MYHLQSVAICPISEWLHLGVDTHGVQVGLLQVLVNELIECLRAALGLHGLMKVKVTILEWLPWPMLHQGLSCVDELPQVLGQVLLMWLTDAQQVYQYEVVTLIVLMQRFRMLKEHLYRRFHASCNPDLSIGLRPVEGQRPSYLNEGESVNSLVVFLSVQLYLWLRYN